MTTLSARWGENRERPLTPKHFPHNRYTFRVLPFSGRPDVNTFRKGEGKAYHAGGVVLESLAEYPICQRRGDREDAVIGYDCYRCLKLRVCDWHEKRVRSGEAICPFFVWALITTGPKYGVCDRQWLQKCTTMSIFVGWLKCCFTSTETVGLLGTGAQDVHFDFHTAPELCIFVHLTLHLNHDRALPPTHSPQKSHTHKKKSCVHSCPSVGPTGPVVLCVGAGLDPPPL